jgi:hypothetical protein
MCFNTSEILFELETKKTKFGVQPCRTNRCGMAFTKLGSSCEHTPYRCRRTIHAGGEALKERWFARLILITNRADHHLLLAKSITVLQKAKCAA